MSMKATEVIARLAQLIAVYGDKEVTYSSERLATDAIVQDRKETLVSPGETESEAVFSIY